MSALGSLIVKLGLDYGEYTGGLSRTEQVTLEAAKKVQDTFDSMSRKVAVTVGAIAGGIAASFAVGTFKNLLSGVVETGAKLDDLRMQTGETVEALSGLLAIGKFNDVDADLLGGAMVKLSSNLAGATEESKGTAKALSALGIEMEAFKQLTPAEQMQSLAKGLDKFEDGAGKSAAAVALLGKEGAKMLPFFNDLASAGELQAKMTTEQAAAAANLDDNLTRLATSGDGWKKELVTGMVPALDLSAQALLDVMNGTGGVRDEVKRLTADGTIREWTTGGIKVLTYFADTLEYVWRVLKAGGKYLGGYAAAAMTTFGGIASAIRKVMSGDFTGAFEDVKSTVRQTGTIIQELGTDVVQSFGEDTMGARIRARMDELGSMGSKAEEAKPKLDFSNVVAKTGKAAAEAKNPVDALIDSIVKKTAAYSAELANESKLTDGQKLAIDVLDQLRTGKVKVTEAESALIGMRLREMLAAEQQLQVHTLEVATLEQERVARAALTKGYEDSARSMAEGNNSLREEIELIGKTAREKTAILQARNQEIILIKQATLAEIQRRDSAKETMSREQIALTYDIEQLKERNELLGLKGVADEAATAQERMREQSKQTLQQVEDWFTSSFLDLMNRGKSGWEAMCQSLKNSFYTLVVKQLYKAFLEPMVVRIIANFSGGSSGNGVMDLVSSALGGGSSGNSSGGMSITNILGMGRSLYNMFAGQGGLLSSLGSFLGLGSAAASGLGMTATTGSGLALVGTTGSGLGLTAGAGTGLSLGVGGGGLGLTAPVGAGTSAGAGGMSGMAAAWPLAVIAGMFMSNKLFSAGMSANTYSGAQRATDPGNYLGTKILSPILGERTANILTGAPVAKYIFDSLFGRKLKDAGIEGEFGGESGFSGRKFEYYKGGLFRSNKTKYSELDEDTRSVFAEQFTTVKDTIGEMATSIGLGTEALDSFKAKFKLSMMGLTDDEINAKVAEEFKKLADQMSELVLTTDKYTQGEESRTETLARLSTRLSAANSWLETMGDNLLEVSVVGADAASSLIDHFGGDEGFATATQNYYKKYFSGAQQLENVNKQLAGTFKELGFDAVPASREALKELINAQDLTTEEGRKTYASLMGVADALDLVVTASDQMKQLKDNLGIELLRAQGKEEEAMHRERMQRLDELKDAGQDIIDTQEEIWKAEDAARRKELVLSATGLSIDTLVDGFIGEINEGRGAKAGAWLANEISMGFEQAIYGQAVGIIMSAIIDGVVTPVVTAAMTGSAVSEAVAGASIQAMVNNAKIAAEALGMLLSDPAFKEAFAEVKKIITELGNTIGVTIPPMSTYNQVVQNTGNAYGNSVSSIEKAADSAQKLADTMRSLGDSIVDEIKRIRGVVAGDGAEGFAAMQSHFAIATAQARAGDEEAARNLPELSRNLLDLAASNMRTTADLKFFQATTAASLQITLEAMSKKFGFEVPAFAGGGDHTGGWAIVGEQGPELAYLPPARIYTANQTRQMTGAGGGGQEVGGFGGRIVRELELMNERMRVVERSTEKSAQTQDRMERNGFPVVNQPGTNLATKEVA